MARGNKASLNAKGAGFDLYTMVQDIAWLKAGKLSVLWAISVLGTVLAFAFLYVEMRYGELDGRLRAVETQQVLIITNQGYIMQAQEDMIATQQEIMETQKEILKRLPPLPEGYSPAYYQEIYPEYTIQYPVYLPAPAPAPTPAPAPAPIQ